MDNWLPAKFSSSKVHRQNSGLYQSKSSILANSNTAAFATCKGKSFGLSYQLQQVEVVLKLIRAN